MIEVINGLSYIDHSIEEPGSYLLLMNIKAT